MREFICVVNATNEYYKLQITFRRDYLAMGELCYGGYADTKFSAFLGENPALSIFEHKNGQYNRQTITYHLADRALIAKLNDTDEILHPAHIDQMVLKEVYQPMKNHIDLDEEKKIKTEAVITQIRARIKKRELMGNQSSINHKILQSQQKKAGFPTPINTSKFVTKRKKGSSRKVHFETPTTSFQLRTINLSEVFFATPQAHQDFIEQLTKMSYSNTPKNETNSNTQRNENCESSNTTPRSENNATWATVASPPSEQSDQTSHETSPVSDSSGLNDNDAIPNSLNVMSFGHHHSSLNKASGAGSIQTISTGSTSIGECKSGEEIVSSGATGQRKYISPMGILKPSYADSVPKPTNKRQVSFPDKQQGQSLVSMRPLSPQLEVDSLASSRDSSRALEIPTNNESFSNVASTPISLVGSDAGGTSLKQNNATPFSPIDISLLSISAPVTPDSAQSESHQPSQLKSHTTPPRTSASFLLFCALCKKPEGYWGCMIFFLGWVGVTLATPAPAVFYAGATMLSVGTALMAGSIFRTFNAQPMRNDILSVGLSM
ncbi:MAG TPA: hypothetical protein VHD33_01835 [Legionellaceae bacterium]|nr:hypothetical protein [Legionellaceae bacterium]